MLRLSDKERHNHGHRNANGENLFGLIKDHELFVTNKT